MATRLSEDPVSVLLLEAGGSDYDNEFTRIPLPWLRLLRSKEDWGFSTVPQEFSSFAIKDRVSHILHYYIYPRIENSTHCTN